MRPPRAPAAQAAFVLHHYDWSETSLILDLFTRESGRIAVAAKGAKRPYSQLRAVLLPLQRIQVSLSKPSKDAGADGVQTLRGAEWGGGNTLPSGAALFSGYYLNELLMKLLARHDPHPALFDAYADTLVALAQADDTAALRAFELRLLSELGLLPDLSVVTATQQALDAAARYQLSPEAGLVSASFEAGALSGAVLTQLQAALLHGSGAALRQACATELPTLKTALRGLLNYHLGPQPLRTRALLLDVQKLLDA
jgi:DNA repair protein RecO (recombination protein O)